MPAEVMDGRKVAGCIERQVQCHVQELTAHGVVPRLGIVLIGGNPESALYVSRKQKKCAELGINSHLLECKSDIAADEIERQVKEWSDDPNYHGILTQLPLPNPIERVKYRIFDAIKPEKDVDAVSGEVVKYFYRGEEGLFLPCTPRGVLNLLKYYNIDTEGKHVVVTGRNDITGKPMMMILGGRLANATVTWCHRHTRKLEEYTRRADILVTCIGQPGIIRKDMVKPGAVVIDVGIRRTPAGIRGDVDFEPVAEVASYITPVPGGTGPLTVAALMQNLVDAARYSLGGRKADYTIAPEATSAGAPASSPPDSARTPLAKEVANG
jgi:methylenetetrahydrofolate dehydrogenase (NADP+)/methenyltetrahydrofolate cyclohydrolase